MTVLPALLGAGLVVSLAGAEQLSMIVLNPETPRSAAVPSGWQVKVNRGSPDISVLQEGGSSYIHLKSRRSSYGLERAVDVDPSQFPVLSWRWKVTELPQGGDFRHARTDDQAAQVLVAFADRRVLTYIWDTTAPQGTEQSASSIPLLRIWAIVCRSGGAEANRWISESRNVAQDYDRAYGRPAPHVRGLRLQINSQHTGTSAESSFGEVSFRKAQQ